jgi:hypothetical protein
MTAVAAPRKLVTDNWKREETRTSEIVNPIRTRKTASSKTRPSVVPLLPSPNSKTTCFSLGSRTFHEFCRFFCFFFSFPFFLFRISGQTDWEEEGKMSGWWGASDEGKPVVMPELPSPASKEEYRAVASVALAQVLSLEGHNNSHGSRTDGGDIDNVDRDGDGKGGGEFGGGAGWNQIDFECTYGEPDVRLLDLPPAPGGAQISTVKVCASMPCPPQVII